MIVADICSLTKYFCLIIWFALGHGATASRSKGNGAGSLTPHFAVPPWPLSSTILECCGDRTGKAATKTKEKKNKKEKVTVILEIILQNDLLWIGEENLIRFLRNLSSNNFWLSTSLPQGVHGLSQLHSGVVIVSTFLFTAEDASNAPPFL